jgi:predicted alpha/beta-fold hydrolase
VAPGPEFIPLPFLGNPHVQTVLSQVLKGPAFTHTTRREAVELPDGDRLLLYDSAPPDWHPGGRVALLLHGLGGCHQSPHVQRLARLLLASGLRVFRLDLRGAGPGAALARRAYHAGCSDDVRAAVRAIRRQCPDAPVVLAGFSLGGNVALKVAGEAAADEVPGLERVAAVGPPIDLERCVALLEEPRNWVYERYYLHGLVHRLRQRRRFFPDLPPVRLPRRLTLRLFDELVTARDWGFAGAADYYRRVSALPLLPRIAVPTLILTARDDPFIAAESFESPDLPPHVHVRIADRGGHLGFLGADGAGGIRWAERRVADWLVDGEAEA